MLRLSKLTDYGTVVLAHMAREPAAVYAAADVAAATRLAVPTVSKLLKCFADGQADALPVVAHATHRLDAAAVMAQAALRDGYWAFDGINNLHRSDLFRLARMNLGATLPALKPRGER